MNQVEILGNLTRDPVIRATSTGKAMARFSVAVNRTYRTPAGEEKTLVDFVNIVAWERMAESVGNYLKKGSRVFVMGRYSTRSYEGQDGQKKYFTEVNAGFIACPLGSSGDDEIDGKGNLYRANRDAVPPFGATPFL